MKKKLLTLMLLTAISLTNLGCSSGNTASTSTEVSVTTEDSSTKDNTATVTADTSDTTPDVPIETRSLSGSFEPTLYDNSSLEGILTSIQADYSNTIENLLNRMEETNAIAGTSYEDYKANKQLITDWYVLAIAEEAALFARTEERAMDYYRLMVSTIDHADNNTMEDAMEDFYDDIYNDAMDYFYDEIYDDAMDDLYDTYYDGVVDDGYDYDPYKTWSEECSECYQAWSETSSAIYKAWSATSSTLYRQYSCISSGLYRGDYDVDSIWADYQKKLAMEEAEKVLEDAEGIRPEFLAAMDEYEAFFDEYIAFIQIYQDSSPEDAVLMIEEYSEYMTQYVETMEAFSNIASEEMTTEESLYYAEISSQITAKLLEIQ